MRIGRFPLLSAITVIVAGCAASVDAPVGTPHLVVQLSGDTQPIVDVEGPYGAVAMKDHAVAIRVWPDGLDDGLADVSIIVTNNSWNTLLLDPANVTITGKRSGVITVLDRDAMLASLDVDATGDQRNTGRDIGPLTEQRSSQAVRATDGTMGGTRMSGDVGSTAVDPALMAAARSAPGTRHDAPNAVDEDRLAETSAAIKAWYLQRVEIYPGDTAAGGISFALPPADDDLTVVIKVANQSYPFELRYERLP